MRNSVRHSKDGFILPTILVFITILSVLGASIVSISLQTQTQAIRHSYVQIAHIASKAAIDYAEEQYELNSGYSGTAEEDLIINSKYRVTIEVVILYNESSTAKRIQAYGRVYIPEQSTTALFVRDIKASIIRNGEVVADVDPSDYDPIVWLDANYSESLTKFNPPREQTIMAVYGSTNKDITEEGGSNATTSGNRGLQNYSGDDLEMSWDGSSLGHQKIGLKFRGLNVNTADTIEEAYIQFRNDELKAPSSSQPLQLLVEGIAQDNASSFNGNYAVTNAPKTTSKVTWTVPNWNVVGASGANERIDVTSIVREITSRSGWSSGNSIAFSISWITGSGVRTAEKGSPDPAPSLYVRRPASSTGDFASSDGDSITSWVDRSGNGNNATFTYGTRPVLKTNQQNSLNAVRFSANGILRAPLTTVMQGNSVTVFMIARPRSSGTTSARFMSLMNSAENSDSNTYFGIIPFKQVSNGSSIENYYRNQTGESISSALNDSWSIYASLISASDAERLVRNSNDNSTNSISNINYSQAPTAPYYGGINELFLGGARSSAAGAYYANFDVAEIVVYNKVLSCSEIQFLNEHFEGKYNIAIGSLSC
jgi:hypothetical protein